MSYKRKQGQPEGISKILDKYSYIDARRRYILSWDHAKFVNHSCNPNTMTSGYGFEIAIRGIEPDEEITDEYGLLNIEEPMRCFCGSARCRTWVTPEDSPKLTKDWDILVKSALDNLTGVDQPLVRLYPESLPKTLTAYLEKMSRYKSVRSVLLKPNGRETTTP